jgi:hypothetical protein
LAGFTNPIAEDQKKRGSRFYGLGKKEGKPQTHYHVLLTPGEEDAAS